MKKNNMMMKKKEREEDDNDDGDANCNCEPEENRIPLITIMIMINHNVVRLHLSFSILPCCMEPSFFLGPVLAHLFPQRFLVVPIEPLDLP